MSVFGEERMFDWKLYEEGEKMLIKAERIDNLQSKVSEYKNKVVVKYLQLRGYKCDTSRKSMIQVNNLLKSEMKRVVIESKYERLSRLGAYYTWEAEIKVKIVNIITGKEV